MYRGQKSKHGGRTEGAGSAGGAEEGMHASLFGRVA